LLRVSSNKTLVKQAWCASAATAAQTREEAGYVCITLAAPFGQASCFQPKHSSEEYVLIRIHVAVIDG
jgi:hypothetical protein